MVELKKKRIPYFNRTKFILYSWNRTIIDSLCIASGNESFGVDGGNHFFQPDRLQQMADKVLTKEPKVKSTAVRQMRTEVRKILDTIK